MNRRNYADFDDDMQDEVFPQHKPRSLTSDHRVKKMRREFDEGRNRRHQKRREH